MWNTDNCDNFDNYQPCRVFLDKELVIKIMMDTRTKAEVKFRSKLGIN